ncbi:putative RNA-directed DNA polymerase [Helianthus annuus]|nr:putative RNA-directed DNA polymerase [Helianthus annuus]
MAPITVVQLAASTHFTITLTGDNFPTWRKHVYSTLVGLDLVHFITGTKPTPAEFLDADSTKPNPEYYPWFRQDQIILASLLGSCSPTIQPTIASADTAREAWELLVTSYANSSQSRIISLKSKLASNPRGTRTITEYLRDMKSIADELALVQHPVKDEDLMVHILCQLGEEYKNVAQSLRLLNSKLTFPELFEKLVDIERELHQTTVASPLMATANFTQRHTRNGSRSASDRRNMQGNFNNKPFRNQWSNGSNSGNRDTRTNVYCQYCNFAGHEAKDCRKLARFLRENHVTTGNSMTQNKASPAANVATSSYMFDTGASHHVDPDRQSFHSVSEYGGPDEMFSAMDLRTGARLMRGENYLDIYYESLPSLPQINAVSTTSPLDWHHKLGHPSIRILKKVAKCLGLNFNLLNFHCNSCSINKSHKDSFGMNSFTATKPLQLIYSDVWGPVEKSIDGFAYYVIFVDFHTKYIWLYPMKHKSDVSLLFPQFKVLVENFFQTPLISLFTDNGGEYIGLTAYLQAQGISHFTTPPHTPEQNGVAERRHRHIVETGLSLLHYAHLPLSFWTHAFQTAVYLINRLPTPILDFKSPYSVLFQKNPTYNKLKPFGCLCYPWLRPYAKSKLHPRSEKCIFLGYSPSKSAYKCYDPKGRRLYHSRHVEFVETNFPLLSEPHSSHKIPTVEKFLNIPVDPPPSSNHAQHVDHFQNHTPTPPTPIHSPSTQQPTLQNNTGPLDPTDQPHPSHTISTHSTPTSPSHSASYSPTLNTNTQNQNSPSSSETIHSESSPSSPSVTNTPQPPSTNSPTSLPPRTRKPNTKYFNSKFVNQTTLHPIPLTTEPTTHIQAMKDSEWRKAMDNEFNALLKNATWELVPPSHHKPIGCKWIFRIKRRPDGSIEKYKARLVAKGFLQEHGKDYFETFSPVTKPVTIRTVLAIALSQNWPIRQLDVNNAFLHGTLHEDVFMSQPPGYVNQDLPNHLCRLRKSLYGLKQAPRAWYLELATFLLQLGFTKSLADPSLFIYNRGGIVSYFLVYVDDIVLTGNKNSFVQHVIQALSSKFSIKDLGMLHHFLGIEVISTVNGLFLSQHAHVQNLLTKFKMDGAKPVATPLSSTETLSLVDGSPKVDPTLYRQLVGSLQYLAFTRPDVSFAVNKLSQYMHAPTQLHWQALKRVLRYLKGTIYHGLFLNRGSPIQLQAFTDSDWGGIADGGRSTTAYIIYLGSNIISWRSARQKSVSRSSTEAEYKALANGAAEVSWVQNLLLELGLSLAKSPTLYCDNAGATYLCANPVYHSRMKHVALDYHFVREKVADGSLQVQHIHSADQLADVLTKPLGRGPFQRLRSKIGVSDGSSILRGHIKDDYNNVK